MRFEQTWQGGRFDPAGQESYPRFPVEVPGNIQYDYAKHQLGMDLDALMYASQVKQLEETESWYWEYQTTLQFDAAAGQRVMLVAEGVDYSFDIRLDGVLLHQQEGMYTPVALDVTDKAHPGSLLQFIIHPHPQSGGPYTTGYRQAANQSCKPPFCYGWDWNPRLLISGLWMPVYIETRGPGFIRSCEPFYTLNETRDQARVRFETDCDAPVTYTLFDREGQIVYQGTDNECTLENVHLWWCNGQGEPYLYTWTAETEDDCKQGRIGFKTLRLVRNEGTMNEPADFPKSRYAAAVTIELNGRRIFGKGSNWVNPEMFLGRVTKERYQELLEAARDAHMNILRIWGGSGINKPAFYDLCDELGLLVWQEFMLACNNYEGTPHYLAVLEQEGAAVIRRLRSHACLALWCGGNELFNGWSGMDDQSHALRLLNKLCYEMDFARPFLMTSPSTGMGHGGYTFQDRETGEDVLCSFPKKHFTAYTEFGVPALADEEQLQKIVPPEELFPLQPTENWFTHHMFGAWGPDDDAWICRGMVRGYFGEPQSLAEMVRDTQWLQSSGYQAIFEEARRQWPYCSLAINWCYDEPWITASNNSIIAYPFRKKPGYFAVQGALRPVLASARIPHFAWQDGDGFDAQLWYLNDSDETVQDEVTAVLRIGDWEKELLTWQTDPVAPRTNLQGPAIHCVLPEIPDAEAVELILQTGTAGRENTYRLRYTMRHPVVRAGRLNA